MFEKKDSSTRAVEGESEEKWMTAICANVCIKTKGQGRLWWKKNDPVCAVCVFPFNASLKLNPPTQGEERGESSSKRNDPFQFIRSECQMKSSLNLCTHELSKATRGIEAGDRGALGLFGMNDDHISQILYTAHTRQPLSVCCPVVFHLIISF